ncbi:E3 ubiquitin-protein ligase AMFR-like [Hydra vulgaris]|uniref:E3 ubiquitin-protein ligase AMFR-like n=1 Tax=Hydra vulgaris TaxID=6087 RepID=A0ABM4DPN5_HYDVU
MPFFFSERLPVPSLKSYCTLSLVIFLVSALFAKKKIHQHDEIDSNVSQFDSIYDVYLNESFCLWSLINMAYCCLFLFGKVIQKLVLGDLRVSEEQHLQDKFWNYIFYKVIFVFGVVNAQSITEVLCWAAWFSMLGFWHIFGQLCKDRYKYLTSSPFTPRSKHVKLMVLICVICLSSTVMGVWAVSYGYQESVNIMLFMLAECILLGLKSLHLLTRYMFQILEIQTGNWDKKSKVAYYIDLISECLVLTVDLCYHVHMLVWSNVFLSMASLVLYWNIRSIVSEFKKCLKVHRLYQKVIKSVSTRFQLATQDELNEVADHCAICWDSMETARKLPCGHFFHHSCLCSWLQQDVSCPTCRRSLTKDMGLPPNLLTEEEHTDELPDVTMDRNESVNGFRNFFFFLDGRQIANWFPSFSIEVFHGRLEQDQNEMNRQVEQLLRLFPHISREAIVSDLQQTGSADVTADNILEGNLTPMLQSIQSPSSEENDTDAQSNDLPLVADKKDILLEAENLTSDGDNQLVDEEEYQLRRRLPMRSSSSIRSARRCLVKSNSNESASSSELLKEKEERRNLLLQATEKRIHPINES